MRLLVTGGGTGGHVYPALSVVEALRDGDADWQETDRVAWVGRPDSLEARLVAQAGLDFYGVPAGAVRGQGPFALLGSLVRLVRGVVAALRVVASYRPNVVLATGGYVSAPLAVAAWFVRCPVLIYLPDMEPGLAVKTLSRWAARVAVSFEAVAVHLPRRKVVVTGYPVRARLHRVTKGQARATLGLRDDVPVVLALGGSRGARRINRAVGGCLEALLRGAQWVHISGEEDYAALAAQRETLSPDAQQRYHLYAYLHDEMVDALAAADLVVARAGAATLGEFPAVGLPAVLVPYPYSGRHQRANAVFLAEAGAAVVVEDGALEQELSTIVTDLLWDPARLAAMAAASLALARPDAARSICRELVALAEGR
ncbi:MAG: undecaprenyldiphospho-muramoylpentapeptide beta-N-acetylglucosaminyltransferase [Chloroflexi bacterium]|nr:undecaprenyldiphospho-muramoylpentapeptide beta-N-acetylglucosaminyltransferase [Chloroflexota bacterium]